MEKRLCSLPLNMEYTTLCLLSARPVASTLVIQVPLEEDIEKNNECSKGVIHPFTNKWIDFPDITTRGR